MFISLPSHSFQDALDTTFPNFSIDVASTREINATGRAVLLSVIGSCIAVRSCRSGHAAYQ